jgi:hypothetical protein
MSIFSRPIVQILAASLSIRRLAKINKDETIISKYNLNAGGLRNSKFMPERVLGN